MLCCWIHSEWCAVDSATKAYTKQECTALFWRYKKLYPMGLHTYAHWPQRNHRSVEKPFDHCLALSSDCSIEIAEFWHCSPYWHCYITGRRVLEYLNWLRTWPLRALISIICWCQTIYENIIHIFKAEKQLFQMIWHTIAPYQSNGNQSRKNTCENVHLNTKNLCFSSKQMPFTKLSNDDTGKTFEHIVFLIL